jgi:hypothetical protein
MSYEKNVSLTGETKREKDTSPLFSRKKRGFHHAYEGNEE